MNSLGQVTQLFKSVAESIDEAPDKYSHLLNSLTKMMRRGEVREPRLIASIVRLKRDGSMKTHSYSDAERLPQDFGNNFRWKLPIRGVAGMSAATKQVLWVPDLRPLHIREAVSYVSIDGDKSLSYMGGIICVPILARKITRRSLTPMSVCMAVLSVSTNVPNYFTQKHVETAISFSGHVYNYLMKRTQSQYRWYNFANQKVSPFNMPKEQYRQLAPETPQPVDEIMEKYRQLSSQERADLIREIGREVVGDTSTTDYVVDTIINELESATNRKTTPTKQEQILLMFKEANRYGEQVDLSTVARLYAHPEKDEDYSRMRASRAIYKLNLKISQACDELGVEPFQIERSSEYRFSYD